MTSPMKTLKLAGLANSITIIRDKHAIPHIYGTTADDDVFLALGYVHATDRMWQMDMFRRMAEGNLAEILGESAFEQDVFCRTLGFARAAERCLAAMQENSPTYRCLSAYSRGVNARIEELAPDELPVYFKTLGYTMAPWSPIDTLSFLRYVAWLLCGSFDDLWLLTLADKLGADAIDELYPFDRPYEIPIVPEKKILKPRKMSSVIPKNIPGLLDAARDILDRALRTGFWQRLRSSAGSNNWAIDGTKSASGAPILCNDPHLEFMLPSVWYIAHLATEKMNVAGGTFPGIPAVLVGHNDRIAWGVTNTQADVVDFFYEKVHPKDTSKYRHKGRWRRFETVNETVSIRGIGPREVTIELSVHGPVLTRKGQTITMQWTGHELSDEVQTFLRLSSATSFADFLDALRCAGVPAQNFAYADKEGTIAIFPAGKFPIRKHGFGRVPHDGSSGEFDWRGFIPFSRLKYVVNPGSHYVASANQRPVGGSYPYHYLGWQWDANYRARRIKHLLASNKLLTLDDMKRFQLDVHDCAAESFLPALFSAFEEENPEELVGNALALLKTWDCKATPDSVAATIWMTWFLYLRDAFWGVVWNTAGAPTEGCWGFADNSWYPPTELLERILRQPEEETVLNTVKIPHGDDLDALVRHSFEQAVTDLATKAGEDMTAWRWAQFNKAQFESLSKVEALSRKDVPVGGTMYTLYPGGKSDGVVAGATLRFIVSFDHPDEALVVYPGGQSEDGASPHYADLFDAWVNGDYIHLVSYQFPENFPNEQVSSVTVLSPV